MISSIASLPSSKSSAVISYDAMSKSEVMKKEIDDELFLPIKYLYKYSISCLENNSDEETFANIGISVLNILGAFTETTIDYPEHWFLIAEVSNWTKDIDNIISKTRDAIKIKKRFNSLPNRIYENYERTKYKFCFRFDDTKSQNL